MGRKSREEKYRKVRCYPVLLLAGLVAAAIFVVARDVGRVRAVYDADKTVYMTDSEIAQATLLIGTHLVALNALDDQIYEIALQSATESGQTRIYYKSELADGAWYDITDAKDLSDISTTGTPVTAETIEGMPLAYYTMEDGLTYDLHSNREVCIFDINDPYDLDAMPELYELKNLYQQLRKKKNMTESEEYIADLLADFYETKQRTINTDGLDKKIEGLQAYYNSLAGNAEVSLEQRSIVHRVMKMVDASRRAAVYGKLYESDLQVLLKNLQGISGKEIPEAYVPSAEIDEAVENAWMAVQEQCRIYENQMLKEGTTVQSKIPLQSGIDIGGAGRKSG